MELAANRTDAAVVNYNFLLLSEHISVFFLFQSIYGHWDWRLFCDVPLVSQEEEQYK